MLAEPNPTPAVPRACRARRPRGFTLVEIIVALAAGLIVSMAAFFLAKNATNFFQHEARIATAQLATSFGIIRLSNDLQRASFLTTRNVNSDTAVCKDSASWTALGGLSNLAGIYISNSTSAPAGTPPTTAFSPYNQQIVIGGSFTSTEVFTVECATVAGGSYAFQLQTAQYDNAMARTVANLGAGETLATKIPTIFPAGRILDIYDPSLATHVFGVITSATANASNVATIQLNATPTIPTKPTSGCGLLQPPHCGKGWVVAPVQQVRYEIRQVAAGAANNAYQQMLASPVAPDGTALSAVNGDANRTELVRVEVLPASMDTEDPNSLEVVSEFAVDLAFGITVASKSDVSNYNPTVTSYGIGDSNVTSIAKLVGGGNNGTPQLIRSVQARLSTRTRAPDRETDISSASSTDGRRLRMDLGLAAPLHYARLRTSYANVTLPNQGGFSLW